MPLRHPPHLQRPHEMSGAATGGGCPPGAMIADLLMLKVYWSSDFGRKVTEDAVKSFTSHLATVRHELGILCVLSDNLIHACVVPAYELIVTTLQLERYNIANIDLLILFEHNVFHK